MGIADERRDRSIEIAENRAELVGKIMKMWSDGHPLHEIADSLKLPESTVRSLVKSELRYWIEQKS